MGWFIVVRAILVRATFAFHGILVIWLLTIVTNDVTCWYIAASLSGLLLEAFVTIYKRKGQEWKW